MLVRELTLGQFRSHAATRLVLDGRPVAITGANGAGKTSILEAVSMLAPGRGLRGAPVEEMARTPGTVWRVAALVETQGAAREIETTAESGARQVRIDGKAASQAALGGVLRILWLTPAMDRLWLDAPEARRRFLDRLALSFHPGHAEAALRFEKALRERNRLLREGGAQPAWLGALEAQMAASGAVLAANRRAALDRIGAAMDDGSAFPAAEVALAYPEPTPETEAELAALWAAGRARDLAAGRTLIGPQRADMAVRHAAKGIAAAQASTGEQKALLIAIVLANARALAAETGAPPVLLLDEVAAHLDDTRRAALHAAIATLGAQAFMTGTEAALFGDWGGDAARLHVAEAGGRSVIGGAEA
jgi:DNA replication and repair protein RecF